MTSLTPTTAVSRPFERMWTFFDVEREAFAVDGVAVGVAWAELPHRVPIADVRPADVGRHHRGALGALHHRVVDRLLRRALERRLVEREEAEVVARRRERRLGASTISGSKARNSSSIASARKKKLPEFQR